MSRLYRGLWQVELVYSDRLAFVPEYPTDYDLACLWAGICADEPGVRSAILRRVPGTRAPWEYRAPYEATDAPKWGEDA